MGPSLRGCIASSQIRVGKTEALLMVHKVWVDFSRDVSLERQGGGARASEQNRERLYERQQGEKHAKIAVVNVTSRPQRQDFVYKKQKLEYGKSYTCELRS